MKAERKQNTLTYTDDGHVQTSEKNRWDDGLFVRFCPLVWRCAMMCHSIALFASQIAMCPSVMSTKVATEVGSPTSTDGQRQSRV